MLHELWATKSKHSASLRYRSGKSVTQTVNYCFVLNAYFKHLMKQEVKWDAAYANGRGPSLNLAQFYNCHSTFVGTILFCASSTLQLFFCFSDCVNVMCLHWVQWAFTRLVLNARSVKYENSSLVIGFSVTTI